MSNLIRLSDVQRREVVWLQHGTIPRGMLSIVAGHPGLGKSLCTVRLAADLSRRGLASVICSAEDSLEHSIKPRLQAAGADTALVHALVPEDEHGDPRGVSFPKDAQMLLEAIRDIDAVLGIIDPISALLDSAVDSHRDASLRSALAPLHRVSEETGAAVVMVFHLNKAGGVDPMMRLGGSIGGPGAARSCLLLDRDPDDPEKDRGPRRVLAHFKCNVGPLQPSRLLTVETVHLPADELEPAVNTARITDAGESSHSAASLLAAATGDRTALDEAVEFLEAELGGVADMGAKDVRKHARQVGISDSTLDRAKKQLGVKAHKEGFGANGSWKWSIDPTKTATTRAHAGGNEFLRSLDDDVVLLGRNGADSAKAVTRQGDKALFDEEGAS